MKILLSFLITFIFLTSCLKYQSPDIYDNVSFPSSFVKYSSNVNSEIQKHYLQLNSNTIGEYKTGSIQDYQYLDNSKLPVLVKSYPIKTAAVNLSINKKEINSHFYLAVSYAKNEDENIINNNIDIFQFDPVSQKIDYYNSFQLKNVGKLQIVRDLYIQDLSGLNDGKLIVYGTIVSSKGKDLYAQNIPNRVFAFLVDTNQNTITNLFYLSYGIGDPNSFAHKTDSLQGYPDNSYFFGSSAPSFYETTQNGQTFYYLMAFPTGTVGGLNYNSIDIFPGVSNFNSSGKIKQYFGAVKDSSKNYYLLNPSESCAASNGDIAKNCVRPDLRAYSVIFVDINSLINNKNINLSTYFVPFVVNKNGVPFGVKGSDGTKIDENNNSDDANTLSFLSNFWSSFTLQTEPSNCNQKSIDQFNVILNCQNSALISKQTFYGSNLMSVFQMTGLDNIANDISKIVPPVDNTNDFKTIQNNFIIDPFVIKKNTVTDDHFFNFPLTPYVVSLLPSESTNSISSHETTVSQFGTYTANKSDSSQEIGIYWIRVTTKSDSVYGLDSSWIESPKELIHSDPKEIGTYSQAIFDPSNKRTFSFSDYGSQTCLSFQKDISTGINCVNYLTGDDNLFSFLSSDSADILSFVLKK